MVINHRYSKRKKKIVSKILAYLLTAVIICGAAFGLYTLITNVTKDGGNPDNDKPIIIDKTVYIQLPGATKIKALIDDYNLTGSIWMLVNKSRPISTDYAPSYSIPDVLTNQNKNSDERSTRTDIQLHIKNLFDDAASAGYNLMIGSGYRSADLQAYYYNSSVSAYGEEVANQSTAKPGQSEHQTGLAIDIATSDQRCYIETCFKDTAEGQWLAENSYKYGFIMRYPSGKESITGYEYEPWHFRYVGIDLATALHQSGLTLDEAWSYLQTARQALIDNGSI